MKDKKAYAGIVVTGAVIGLIAVVLVMLGNPKNMGFCIACFLRDIAGATKLHSAPVVQYFRPEIVGLIGGALIMAMVSKEFSPKGGSAPVTRFFLGAFVMIGALVFLGCPLRMVLRIGGGDLNAIVGLAGFAVGIVDRDKMITGKTIAKGDVLVGIASSGIHSNGYSLVRKVFDIKKDNLNRSYECLGGKTLGETIITTTIIYDKA